jgi:hypothetical protein
MNNRGYADQIEALEEEIERLKGELDEAIELLQEAKGLVENV